jgi:hypothetical protein
VYKLDFREAQRIAKVACGKIALGLVYRDRRVLRGCFGITIDAINTWTLLSKEFRLHVRSVSLGATLNISAALSSSC